MERDVGMLKKLIDEVFTVLGWIAIGLLWVIFTVGDYTLGLVDIKEPE